MNTFFNQMKSDAENIRLTSEEKKAMRAELQRAMSATAPQPIQSPYQRFFAPQFFALYSFVALIMLTTGTTYAANGSLPGSFLYPIKIHVSEPLATVFARTPEAKALVNVQIAEQRIHEIQELAAQGTLDATTTAIAEKSFDYHASQAATLTEESSRTKAKDFAEKTAASFDALGTMLASTSEQNSDEDIKRNSQSFAKHVRERAQSILENDFKKRSNGEGNSKTPDEQ